MFSIDYRLSFLAYYLLKLILKSMSEKGKPLERVGRKATGLSLTK